MNKSFVQVDLLVVATCLVLWGCSRPAGREGGNRGRDKSSACGQRSDGLDLSRELEDWAQSFALGDGTPIRRGEAILDKIVNFPDANCRTNGLAQFRKAIFAIEFSGSNYIALNNGRSSMEALQWSYLSAACRCGYGLDESMGFRIDFLRWLKREMGRPLGVGTNCIERRLGPYVSRLTIPRESYQKGLTNSYERHLLLMEDEFNFASRNPKFTNQIDAVRYQLETFLGRPIRTDEELRRDSGMK